MAKDYGVGFPIWNEIPTPKIEPKPCCPNCGSEDLAKIKGCVRCLKCGFKEDCNGW